MTAVRSQYTHLIDINMSTFSVVLHIHEYAHVYKVSERDFQTKHVWPKLEMVRVINLRRV